MDFIPNQEQMKERIVRAMGEVIQHTTKKEIPVKKIIKFGNPANEIAITAAHEDADIILIPKDFFGSTECSDGRNAN